MYTKISSYNFIQTFYVGSDKVGGSTEAFLTSVDLYFKMLPDAAKNASGVSSPGVSIAICDMVNNVPVLEKCYQESITRKSFDQISAFSDASVATNFGFGTPLKITTNRFYGIVIIFEDPGFVLWTNKTGDKLVGTNTKSSGSNLVNDGQLFTYNSTGTFKSLSDTDLKFKLNAAKFTANTVVDTYTNKNYEFFTLNTGYYTFIPGEYVYKAAANATGTINITSGNNAIVGTGTNFVGLTPGDKIVIFGNTSRPEVVTVQNIANSTYLTVLESIPYSNTSTKYMQTAVGKVFYRDVIFNKLFLDHSTANTTYYFANSDTVVGVDSHASAVISTVDDFGISGFRTFTNSGAPSIGEISISMALTSWNGSSYIANTINKFKPILNSPNQFGLTTHDIRLLSRSKEIGQTLFSNSSLLISNKSMLIDVTTSVKQSTDSLYTSPIINNGQLDLYLMKYNISSNTHVNDANSVSIDTEVTDNGNAKTRYISTKSSFANNKYAEDLMLYMTAYRPANTYIQVYARLHNSQDSDAFDDKAWTRLDYVENANVYSSSSNTSDLVEYTLNLPQYSATANALPGTFTTQNGNTVIVASGVAPNTYVLANDLVKVYNPLVPQNYIIAVATASNTTAITLGSPVSNTNLVGTGFKVDRLKYRNTAFKNITNDNVARYYSTSLNEFDGFDTYQIKIVLLSDTTYLVPKVDHYQAIGVSS